MAPYSLNHEVLKQTEGLLAEIDRVVAAPSVAERVDRLLESACSEIRVARYNSFRAWEVFERGVTTDDVGELIELDRDVIPGYSCGCDYLDDEYGRVMTECCLADPPTDNPIFWTIGPYNGGKAADEPCGNVECACMDLFEPKIPRPDPTSRYQYIHQFVNPGRLPEAERRQFNYQLAMFGEACVPVGRLSERPPSEQTIIRQGGVRAHLLAQDETADFDWSQLEARMLADVGDALARSLDRAAERAESGHEEEAPVSQGLNFEDRVQTYLTQRSSRNRFLDITAD